MKKEASFTDKVYQASCQVLVDELNLRFEGRAIASYEPDAYGFHYILVRRFKPLEQVWGMQVDWHVMDKMLTFNAYPDMVAKKIQEALNKEFGNEG